MQPNMATIRVYNRNDPITIVEKMQTGIEFAIDTAKGIIKDVGSDYYAIIRGPADQQIVEYVNGEIEVRFMFDPNW